ncbi:hypothetical protein H4R18_004784 [Coemansia javaensis]|uniref:Rab-GAP TBC domain-containing protein n=1 Tax=Coemansia javaensis TaxID=2761396 RepID=A0A9W8H4P0_9FUNG|nr:hypothetical protein H4R18_004784 [Coemansia javaensis]
MAEQAAVCRAEHTPPGQSLKAHGGGGGGGALLGSPTAGAFAQRQQQRQQAGALPLPPSSSSSQTVTDAQGAAAMARPASAAPSSASSSSSAASSLRSSLRQQQRPATASAATAGSGAGASHSAVAAQQQRAPDGAGAQNNNSGGDGCVSRAGENACSSDSNGGSAKAARGGGGGGVQPPRHTGQRRSPGGGAGPAAEPDYVDRFGSYYDYLPIVDEAPARERAAGIGGGGSGSPPARAPALRRDEGLKQRGGSPQTFSSSLLRGARGARPGSASDSDSLGLQPARRPHNGSASGGGGGGANRRSIASRVSSLAESVRAPAASITKSVRRRNLHQASQHSRRVATRLLMRAGLSRIAIRVAAMGTGTGAGAAAGAAAAGPGGVFESAEAMASSALEPGAELDPNGLQALRDERRKQVAFVDEFGFMHFEDSDPQRAEQAQHFDAWRARPGNAAKQPRPRTPAQPGSDARWDALLDAFDAPTLRASRKVKRLVQAGVPPAARARFYYVLSGAAALSQPGEYARLAALPAVPIYDVIERDVARCYPDHVMFADAGAAGQRQLRRILRAYAQHNPDIGYCQGMGRLAGLFLIAGLGEEQAFWVLAATIRGAIPRYYEPDLAGLREHTAIFEVLLHERSPRLAEHLAEQGCDALMYATPWFMTVFTLSLPWPAALRVWDWFVFRGPKVLFRVALAIADLAAPFLLEACPTIAEQLAFLLHIPPGLVDADAVIAAAARVKISERHIERLARHAAATSADPLRR